MVMRGSMIRRRPALRRLLACVLVAALPACSHELQSQEPGSPPSDGVFLGSSMTVGTSGAGNYLAGRFAQNHSDLKAASEYLLRALAGDPENVELLQRASLALAADNQLSAASDLATRLLRYDGEAAMAAVMVAERYAREGDWSAVESAVAGLPRRGLNSFITPLIVAWAKVGEGKIDAGLEALAPLAQISNYAPLHDFHAALINDLADRRKAAEQNYSSILAGNAGLTLRTTETAVAFYQRTGQPDKAAELLARFRQEHPESAQAVTGRIAKRPIDGARAGLAEALFDAAGTLRQGRANELAVIFVRMALDLQPDFPLAQVMLADLMQGLGQLQAANDVFKAISPDAPVYWSAQLRVAANYDELDQVDEATKTLEALAVQHPERTDALVTLGDVLRRHKRWGEAVLAYDRAIALMGQPEADQWSVYYARGIALERAKQWARAESDFLKALELQPDEPHVLNYLGYSWIEQGTNFDQAKRMIEKAVAQLPTDGYIVDSLGWAFFRSGDFPKAVEALERAAELHPEDAAINDHLGDALWKVGRQEEARFQWKRALVFDPEPELKVEIDRKLQNGLGGAVIPAAFSTAAPTGKNAAAK